MNVTFQMSLSNAIFWHGQVSLFWHQSSHELSTQRNIKYQKQIHCHQKGQSICEGSNTVRHCMNVCAQSKQMQHLNRKITICWNELTSLDQSPRRITIQIQRIYLETMFPLGSRAMHTVEIERLFDCITLFMAAIISKCEPTLPQFQCYAKYPHINCII